MMLTILQGDALGRLRELSDESVQTCVTSPPYWGLRDYGSNGQIGLEETPEAYTAKLVEVFREVRRVLKNDGTLWLNLGDSYNGSHQSGGMAALNGPANGQKHVDKHQGKLRKLVIGLKPKDIVGIPWRVAFALQADGWYLRSDIIWSKPNPMPESVTDRPTKAHEYLFLLSKNERYFYDSEAIQERTTGNGERLTWQERKLGGEPMRHGLNGAAACGAGSFGSAETRNKRSVWTVPTQPYTEAHFATYPPDLIKPCILAGTKAGDVVLDPFAGSGTTGMVAIELARKAILIELNPAYIELIEQRCTITPGLAL